MQKQEQLLVVSPQNEIKFYGPFHLGSSSLVNISNPTDKPILFKIKTTAPKKYCVRPNTGVIDPKSSTEVAIHLQPFSLYSREKNRHKFMVQSLVAPETDYNVDQLWREAPEEEIMDSKLRCVFEMPTRKLKTPPADKPVTRVKTPLKVEEPTVEETVRAGGDDTSTVEEDCNSAEYQKFKEEENRLLEEIMQLKANVDEIVKEEESASCMAISSVPSFYSPPTGREHTQLVYVALAVVMSCVGLLLGKLIF